MCLMLGQRKCSELKASYRRRQRHPIQTTVTQMIKAAPAMITITTNAVTFITENAVHTT